MGTKNDKKRESKINLFKAYLESKSLLPFDHLLHVKAIEFLKNGEKIKRVEKWMRRMKKEYDKKKL